MKSKSLAFAIVSTIAIFGCDQSSPVSDTDVSSREQEKNLKESPPVEELEENRARQAQLLQEKEAEATEAANRERYAKKIADVLSLADSNC